MDRKPWAEIIASSVYDPATTQQCLILTPDTASEDLARAVRELDRLGIVLPPVVSLILEQWNEQGGQLLLETVPRLLNPEIPAEELDPIAKSMNELFPDFCLMLERTERLAILVDIAARGNIVLAGMASEIYDDVAGKWAYKLPKSRKEIARWEARANIGLSPQMKQMYLRAGGVLQDWICPFFYYLEKMGIGGLYAAIYSKLIDQIPLTAHVVDRLQHFVELGDDGFGNSQGFFADDWRPDNEYTIYEWNHETLRFRRWADDFAGFIARKLVGEG